MWNISEHQKSGAHLEAVIMLLQWVSSTPPDYEMCKKIVWLVNSVASCFSDRLGGTSPSIREEKRICNKAQ
jgi:hypothetical protein